MDESVYHDSYSIAPPAKSPVDYDEANPFTFLGKSRAYPYPLLPQDDSSDDEIRQSFMSTSPPSSTIIPTFTNDVVRSPSVGIPESPRLPPRYDATTPPRPAHARCVIFPDYVLGELSTVAVEDSKERCPGKACVVADDEVVDLCRGTACIRKRRPVLNPSPLSEYTSFPKFWLDPRAKNVDIDKYPMFVNPWAQEAARSSASAADGMKHVPTRGSSTIKKSEPQHSRAVGKLMDALTTPAFGPPAPQPSTQYTPRQLRDLTSNPPLPPQPWEPTKSQQVEQKNAYAKKLARQSPYPWIDKERGRAMLEARKNLEAAKARKLAALNKVDAAIASVTSGLKAESKQYASRSDQITAGLLANLQEKRNETSAAAVQTQVAESSSKTDKSACPAKSLAPKGSVRSRRLRVPLEEDIFGLRPPRNLCPRVANTTGTVSSPTVSLPTAAHQPTTQTTQPTQQKSSHNTITPLPPPPRATASQSHYIEKLKNLHITEEHKPNKKTTTTKPTQGRTRTRETSFEKTLEKISARLGRAPPPLHRDHDLPPLPAKPVLTPRPDKPKPKAKPQSKPKAEVRSSAKPTEQEEKSTLEKQLEALRKALGTTEPGLFDKPAVVLKDGEVRRFKNVLYIENVSNIKRYIEDNQEDEVDSTEEKRRRGEEAVKCGGVVEEDVKDISDNRNEEFAKDGTVESVQTATPVGDATEVKPVKNVENVEKGKEKNREAPEDLQDVELASSDEEDPEWTRVDAEVDQDWEVLEDIVWACGKKTKV